MAHLVSIVIPARNEEENIALVIEEVKRGVEQFKPPAEIIIVDDGSSDRTSEVARRHGARVVPNHGPAHGKGVALQKGFDAARGGYIVMMDGDCSHVAADIPKMIRELDGGAGMVIASRSLGGSEEYTLVRTFGNLLITGLFNVLFGTHLTDAINGFKAFRRELVARPCSASGFEIEVELVARALQARMRVAEMPSQERARYKGRMKSRTIMDGSRFILAVLNHGLRYRFGTRV